MYLLDIGKHTSSKNVLPTHYTTDPVLLDKTLLDNVLLGRVHFRILVVGQTVFHKLSKHLRTDLEEMLDNVYQLHVFDGNFTLSILKLYSTVLDGVGL